ncbi:Myb-like DNA-binding domain containing protein [Tritrichomonas foetus]|uniref:Myb-like DNA-binding domain containing protein n=1 Tax=Tritrichomonas foetus TaxID=1144522 RepID=A0A1J4KQA0_9EUKA|nr:Myb-like DNA-binding domain containing protein [Tritrichomonas foetus]|eukprot:OHT13419.1 Myb-like DNA-binding domain containing protein [Tritrichomonas foetus]
MSEDNDMPLAISSTKKQKRVLFSRVEDMMILSYVECIGPRQWSNIAKQLPDRTGKQCRDRYMNYLAPTINHNKWTEQEDRLLLQKYDEYGPQWTLIRQFFPGRTGNMLKNRWNFNLMHNYSKKGCKKVENFQNIDEKMVKTQCKVEHSDNIYQIFEREYEFLFPIENEENFLNEFMTY